LIAGCEVQNTEKPVSVGLALAQALNVDAHLLNPISDKLLRLSVKLKILLKIIKDLALEFRVI